MWQLNQFFATNECIYTCTLFETGRKDVNCINRKKHSKVDFLCSKLFYSCLCGFITLLWLMVWLIMIGYGIPKGMGTYLYMVSKYFTVMLNLLTHAMLQKWCSGEGYDY